MEALLTSTNEKFIRRYTPLTTTSVALQYYIFPPLSIPLPIET